jgi:hypothetical protein
MFVGSFAGDIIQSQVDIAAAFDQFSASGVTNLVIDVTDNGGLYGFMMEIPNNLTSTAAGGYVCLGLFLHQYLAGMTSGIP